MGEVIALTELVRNPAVKRDEDHVRLCRVLHAVAVLEQASMEPDVGSVLRCLDTQSLRTVVSAIAFVASALPIAVAVRLSVVPRVLAALLAVAGDQVVGEGAGHGQHVDLNPHTVVAWWLSESSLLPRGVQRVQKYLVAAEHPSKVREGIHAALAAQLRLAYIARFIRIAHQRRHLVQMLSELGEALCILALHLHELLQETGLRRDATALREWHVHRERAVSEEELGFVRVMLILVS